MISEQLQSKIIAYKHNPTDEVFSEVFKQFAGYYYRLLKPYEKTSYYEDQKQVGLMAIHQALLTYDPAQAQFSTYLYRSMFGRLAKEVSYHAGYNINYYREKKWNNPEFISVDKLNTKSRFDSNEHRLWEFKDIDKNLERVGVVEDLEKTIELISDPRYRQIFRDYHLGNTNTIKLAKKNKTSHNQIALILNRCEEELSKKLGFEVSLTRHHHTINEKQRQRMIKLHKTQKINKHALAKRFDCSESLVNRLVNGK